MPDGTDSSVLHISLTEPAGLRVRSRLLDLLNDCGPHKTPLRQKQATGIRAGQGGLWRENEWAYKLSVKCPLKKRPLSNV